MQTTGMDAAMLSNRNYFSSCATIILIDKYNVTQLTTMYSTSLTYTSCLHNTEFSYAIFYN